MRIKNKEVRREYGAKFSETGPFYYSRAMPYGNFLVSTKEKEGSCAAIFSWNELFSIYKNIEKLLWSSTK